MSNELLWENYTFLQGLDPPQLVIVICRVDEIVYQQFTGWMIIMALVSSWRGLNCHFKKRFRNASFTSTGQWGVHEVKDDIHHLNIIEPLANPNSCIAVDGGHWLDGRLLRDSFIRHPNRNVRLLSICPRCAGMPFSAAGQPSSLIIQPAEKMYLSSSWVNRGWWLQIPKASVITPSSMPPPPCKHHC